MTLRFRSNIACAAFSAATLVLAGPVGAQGKPGEEAISIEHLLKSGWEIAGYASNCDSRSSLILFKKPGETHFVQCLDARAPNHPELLPAALTPRLVGAKRQPFIDCTACFISSGVTSRTCVETDHM